MRKLKIGLVAMAGVLLALVAVLYLVDFRAPSVAQRIFDAAGAEAGVEIEAESFRLNLLRGMVFERVVARTNIPAGRVVAEIDRIVLEHRLLPLIWGDIVIDDLRLEGPRIEILNDPVAPVAGVRPLPKARIVRVAAGPAQPSGSRGVTRGVRVNAASLSDGTLSVRDGEGELTTEVDGLAAELTGIAVEEGSISVAVGLAGAGHVDIGDVRYGGRVGTGNRAALSAAAGVYTVRGLVLTTAEGRLTMEELIFDLNRDPYTFRTSLAGDDIDLNALISTPGVDSLGTARVEMRASGVGPDSSSVVGTGTVYLSAGIIPDARVLDQVASAIGLQLSGLAYEATTIDFEIAEERVEVAPFEIVSEATRVHASGALAIDGLLDGRAQVRVERARVDLGDWGGGFSDGVLDALTDDTGWISIPLTIGGTVEEPSVRPDSEALLAALQESAGGLGRLLQGIIKRN